MKCWAKYTSEVLVFRECNLTEKNVSLAHCHSMLSFCHTSPLCGKNKKQEHPHLYVHGDLKLRQSACCCSLVSAGWELKFSCRLRSSCLVNAGTKQRPVAESCGCSVQPVGEQTSGAACRKALSPQQSLGYERPPTELHPHCALLMFTHTVHTCILHIGTHKSKTGNSSNIWLWSWGREERFPFRLWQF